MKSHLFQEFIRGMKVFFYDFTIFGQVPEKMKIRIKGNSIRVRLTQPEVKAFCETGRVIDFTQFDSTRFTYGVIQADIEMLRAVFEANAMTLEVPRKLVVDWYENDVIGFKAQQSLSHGGHLSLLLEKDFACLNHTEEDQSNHWPNPKEG